MTSSFTIAYDHPNGILFCGDSLNWLLTLPDEVADLIIADPPYNLKKANWDCFASQEVCIHWSIQWITQAARILKPTGFLYIMGFSEVLADLKAPASRLFWGCRWLIWHYKNKANLGQDWGRSHESILLLRKSSSAKMNIDNIRIPYGNHILKYPDRTQAETSQYCYAKSTNLEQN
ncbi:DNA methyltransferase [Leptodesmis sp.]|uniref:DNA methyltransferase n=1 Tax=Leptodesmis sp. TaxID=3100501 RepID=UPI0040535B25